MTIRKRPARTDALPAAAGALARIAFRYALARGVSLAPLIKQAGLTREQIENRNTWIPVRSQIAFVNQVAEAVGDDCLGFNLGLAFDLREAGLLYYILASSETLIEALQRGTRYSAIANEGIILTLREGRNTFTMTFHYAGVSRHLDRHQIEFWMTALMRACRQITGMRLHPVAARLAHRRDHWPADIAELFGGKLEFGLGKDEIVFDQRAGSLPVVSADRYLNRLLVEYTEQALSSRASRRGSFRASVENAVTPLLPHGKARADVIARELGVSPRTLARRLADEGVTFSALVQELRLDLARRYLTDDGLSISQIAWLLGYREVGAFSHAFKRGTGKTPRQVRAKRR